MHDIPNQQSQAISQQISGFSPGSLLLHFVGEGTFSEAFQRLAHNLADVEVNALRQDLSRMRFHFQSLVTLFLRDATNKEKMASPADPAQLFDIFIAAVSDEREETAFFDQLSEKERTSFAYNLLVILAIMEDYRNLLEVALGGIQSPIGAGAFARYPGPGKQVAGFVVSVSQERHTALLRPINAHGNLLPLSQLTTHFTNTLIVTDRIFPLPEAYWVRMLVQDILPEQYKKLATNEQLHAYRWIYDPAEHRAFGLALFSRQDSLTPSPQAWITRMRGEVNQRLACRVTIGYTARSYEGLTFFLDGDWPLYSDSNESHL